MVGRLTLPENATLGQKLRGFEPVYPWDRPRPIPSETMISIKLLQRTGHATNGLSRLGAFFRASRPLGMVVRYHVGSEVSEVVQVSFR